MSELRIYSEDSSQPESVLDDHGLIAQALSAINVQFETWQETKPLAADADAEEVEKVFADDIARLRQSYGFKSMDVMAIQPDHPEKDALRDKFLHEHTHDDFEVRFFVDGQGLFYLRSGGKIYGLLCTRGDFVSVPAGTLHWFDMGPEPFFKVIRFFVSPDGWVANFTGDDIADGFPRLDALNG